MSSVVKTGNFGEQIKNKKSRENLLNHVELHISPVVYSGHAFL